MKTTMDIGQGSRMRCSTSEAARKARISHIIMMHEKRRMTDGFMMWTKFIAVAVILASVSMFLVYMTIEAAKHDFIPRTSEVAQPPVNITGIY